MAPVEILVVKMTGEKVVYSEAKLRHSLQRSGASEMIVSQVLAKVGAMLYDGITTKEIYNTAFSLLRKSSRPTAARYKLKKAIYELGPSGFPFEIFVAEILKYQGFKTQVGVIVEGNCVNHEIDVIAEKDNKHFMIECKFHNSPGFHCNVKIPLYIQSRFIDVEKGWSKMAGHQAKFHQGWVVTNTRFTTDAIQYGKCVSLRLLGWNYPQTENLKKMIDDAGLHPITSLTTLTKSEKQKLLDDKIVLCMDLCKNNKLLQNIGIKSERIKRILKEAKELCNL